MCLFERLIRIALGGEGLISEHVQRIATSLIIILLFLRRQIPKTILNGVFNSIASIVDRIDLARVAFLPPFSLLCTCHWFTQLRRYNKQ